ncbi:hypothetical protein LCGC14_3159690, partial [marine sediment metagenome]
MAYSSESLASVPPPQQSLVGRPSRQASFLIPVRPPGARNGVFYGWPEIVSARPMYNGGLRLKDEIYQRKNIA